MNNKKSSLNINYRTDMADERVSIYKLENNVDNINGIKLQNKEYENMFESQVDVLNDEAKKLLSKEIGKYITFEIKDVDLLNENEKNEIENVISKKIDELIGKDVKSLLIVGLGNEKVTPDSLGYLTVKNIDVTRHIFKYAKELIDENQIQTSCICPGVLGTTGIETFEIIESVVKKINPDVVIVIDALASTSINRVGSTIQISNTGIVPGNGVRNKRAKISKETLNKEVIAIGVPTVVDMATITNEVIEKIIDDNSDSNEKRSNKRYKKIVDVLDEKNYIVTPKEIDELMVIMSDIIAKAINLTTKRNVTL